MKNSQTGSAIIWILIAVTLFAAIGVVMMRGTIGSTSTVSDEQAKIYAQQVIAYGNDIKAAIKRLQLRGCADTEISFQNDIDANYTNNNAPTDKSCHVFHPNGGGLSFVDNKNVILHNPYFMGNSYIVGVGTSESELIMYGEVDKATCIQINKILHGNTDEPIYDHIGSVAYWNNPAKFKGTYSAAGTIAETSSWRDGLTDACIFRDDYSGSGYDDDYQFYFTLIAR